MNVNTSPRPLFADLDVFFCSPCSFAFPQEYQVILLILMSIALIDSSAKSSKAPYLNPNIHHTLKPRRGRRLSQSFPMSSHGAKSAKKTACSNELSQKKEIIHLPTRLPSPKTRLSKKTSAQMARKCPDPEFKRSIHRLMWRDGKTK